MRLSAHSVLFIGLLFLGLALCLQSMESPSIEYGMGTSIESSNTIEERTGKIFQYVVVPKDGTDAEALNQTESYLQTLTGATHVHSFTCRKRGLLRWWIVDLTPPQVDEVKKQDHVKSVRIDDEVAHHRAIFGPQYSILEEFPGAPVSKRASSYTYQMPKGDSPDHLTQVSQPKGETDYCKYSDFVYEESAGEGIHVYHIEQGVALLNAQEFPPSRFSVPLLTPLAQKNRKSTLAASVHSQCVASVGAGNYYGVAKKAQWHSIKLDSMTSSQIAEGLSLAYEQIVENNHQQKSIVLITSGSKRTLDEIEDDEVLQDQYMYYSQLLYGGVPVVTSAGNTSPNDQSLEIDNTPAIMADDETLPMIVVSSAEQDGEIASYSKRGEKTTLYAMGTVECRALAGPRTASGTSYSAPAAVGRLAVAMSMKEVPFVDETTTDETFAKQAMEWMKTKATWERKPGVNVLWNGATEEDYAALGLIPL